MAEESTAAAVAWLEARGLAFEVVEHLVPKGRDERPRSCSARPAGRPARPAGVRQATHSGKPAPEVRAPRRPLGLISCHVQLGAQLVDPHTWRSPGAEPAGTTRPIRRSPGRRDPGARSRARRTRRRNPRPGADVDRPSAAQRFGQAATRSIRSRPRRAKTRPARARAWSVPGRGRGRSDKQRKSARCWNPLSGLEATCGTALPGGERGVLDRGRCGCRRMVGGGVDCEEVL